MIRLLAFLCGSLFGLGLIVSDMANPARVIAFLDVTGAWDPSLALVIIGALIPSAIAYRWARARNTPLLAAALHVPQRRDIDRNLVIGAAVFGIGWGLAGVCPGPAVALLATGQPFALVFAAAMVAGVLIHGLLHRPRLAKE
ncbi:MULTISPECIES: YeeE/YedE family protein [Xanthomonas]|uniref:YeeE/YedE family protein n=1 Tax=Xanthomonas TaxID=338 RepID=UPI00096DB5E8|nr:YeeE/YedE family protein [Xanthomonas campestris]MCC5095053.1 YeeE/YedE family protein [Xanthomonas campestris pv. incanae]MEA9612464.1 YeeE/YedE family protein [Xanthomonas campestris pv. incanae]RFF40357.1 YeeE/YedE family protein [Xanthomonas campestris pv. incanae]WDJ11160.1 YeeE/YedE family protein [Xanthomonas campestris pv. incanae]